MGRTAIVVGAGLGGLSTAIRLQAAGWDVTVLEKNEDVGGRCNLIHGDGFVFDAGPTLLLMPDVLRSLFAGVGRRLEDYLDLIRCCPNYRIQFGDGSSIDVSSDWDQMAPQLEAIEPGASRALRRYLDDAGYKYRVAREQFVERNFRHWYNFATPANLYYLLTTRTLRKLQKHAAQYFADLRLQLAFTFQTMYLGLAPRDAPSVYALLPYTEIEEGIWHPRGGMGQIPVALARLARELGVEIRTSAEVTRFRTQGRRVSGVELADGSCLTVDVVVTNADLPYAYAHLVPRNRRGRFTDRALRRMRYGSSAFLLYLGVDRQYPQLRHHNAFLSDDPDGNFDAIFKRRELPSDPSLYVGVPNRSDPEMAPAGNDALYVLVPVAATADDAFWAEESDRYRDLVLDKLERLGLEDLRRHIVFEKSFTPADFASTYHTMNGNAFGISHDFFQVGYLRPSNRARDLDNLYFVGASTVPGGGVPMVIIGSNLVTERIAEDWPRD